MNSGKKILGMNTKKYLSELIEDLKSEEGAKEKKATTIPKVKIKLPEPALFSGKLAASTGLAKNEMGTTTSAQESETELTEIEKDKLKKS